MNAPSAKCDLPGKPFLLFLSVLFLSSGKLSLVCIFYIHFSNLCAIKFKMSGIQYTVSHKVEFYVDRKVA